LISVIFSNYGISFYHFYHFESFVVSGNEQKASWHENEMVFGHFIKFRHFIMFTIFNQLAVSENERVAFFNQKYSRFWKLSKISAFYHFKVAAS
jgi:hypothetical protein